jgi:hypothetical protein
MLLHALSDIELLSLGEAETDEFVLFAGGQAVERLVGGWQMRRQRITR